MTGVDWSLIIIYYYLSPNESRTGPYDQKDPHHEEADGPGSKRHCGREQAEINEHAYTLADMAAYPMPSAEPRYGSYHPSERYYRDGPSYPPPLLRLSGTPTYRRYMGPEWGPPHHGASSSTMYIEPGLSHTMGVSRLALARKSGYI
jgi:hypothetical protein